jgi:hypothetical protein
MENVKLTVESIGAGVIYATRAAQVIVEHLANQPAIRELAETVQRFHESGWVQRATEMAGQFLNSPALQEARQVHEAMRASGVLKQMEAMQKWVASPEGQRLVEIQCQIATTTLALPRPLG